MKIYQKQSGSFWIDESGIEIPTNRLTRAEKIMEKNAHKLLVDAQALSVKLSSFKVLIAKLSNEAFDAFMEEKASTKARDHKGNFTWYNFNRTLKIEVAVSERIEFDDLTIKAAKEKFDEFLTREVSTKNEFAKQMVLDAFETQRNNKLDTKRVLGLARYESKIKDTLFSEAVSLIQQSIRRPDSKTYFRIWQKDASGQYQNIDLNLSSI